MTPTRRGFLQGVSYAGSRGLSGTAEFEPSIEPLENSYNHG